MAYVLICIVPKIFFHIFLEPPIKIFTLNITKKYFYNRISLACLKKYEASIECYDETIKQCHENNAKAFYNKGKNILKI